MHKPPSTLGHATEHTTVCATKRRHPIDWHPIGIRLPSKCHPIVIGFASDSHRIGVRLASDWRLTGIQWASDRNVRRMGVRFASDWHLTSISLSRATQGPAARHPPNPLDNDMPHARARIPPTAAEPCDAHSRCPSRPPRRQLRLAEGPVARLVPPSVNTGAYVRQRHNPSPHNIHARVGRPSDRRPARTQLTAPFVRPDRRAEVRPPPVARSPHLCT